MLFRSDSGLPTGVVIKLQEAHFVTIGDLLLQMKLDSDVILAVQGIGPKAMEDIQHTLDSLTFEEASAQTAEEPVEELTGLQNAEIAPVEIVQEAPEISEVAEATVETELTPEASTQGVVEVTAEAAVEASPIEEIEEELPESLDEIFALKPEVFTIPEATDEEEEIDGSKKKGKKGKKRKNAEIEYDPDRDLMLLHKKHKRGDGGWDWD